MSFWLYKICFFSITSYVKFEKMMLAMFLSPPPHSFSKIRRNALAEKVADAPSLPHYIHPSTKIGHRILMTTNTLASVSWLNSHLTCILEFFKRTISVLIWIGHEQFRYLKSEGRKTMLTMVVTKLMTNHNTVNINGTPTMTWTNLQLLLQLQHQELQHAFYSKLISIETYCNHFFGILTLVTTVFTGGPTYWNNVLGILARCTAVHAAVLESKKVENWIGKHWNG